MKKQAPVQVSTLLIGLLFAPLIASAQGQVASAQGQVASAQGQVASTGTQEERPIQLQDQSKTLNTNPQSITSIHDASRSKSMFDKLQEVLLDFRGSLSGYLKDVSFSVPIKLPININGFQSDLKYIVRIQPGYLGGKYFRRTDEYQLPLLKAGSWSLPNKERILFNIQEGTKFTVYRMMETFNEAVTPPNRSFPVLDGFFSKLPIIDYVIDHIPTSAENILEKLQPGEMVHLQIPLNISAAYPFWEQAKKYTQGSLGVSNIYRGGYDIFVFRGENNKVRLRIIPSTEIGWELGFAYDGNRDILNKLTRLMARALGGIGIFDAAITRSQQKLFVADYSLDFNKQEVRTAYNSLLGQYFSYSTIGETFRSTLKTFKEVAKITVPSSIDDIRNSLVSKLDDIENLVFEDLDLPIAKQRVHSNIMGDNSPDGIQIPLKIGIPFIWSADLHLTKFNNKLTRRVFKQNHSGWNIERENYLFPSWSSSFKTKSRIFKHEEEVFRSLNIIHLADDKLEKPIKFLSIGFDYDLKDNSYSASEHTQFINHIRAVLPTPMFDEMYTQMVEKGLDVIAEPKKNVNVVLHYFINEEGLRAIEERFKDKSKDVVELEIMNLLVEHIRTLKDLISTPASEGHQSTGALCVKAGLPTMSGVRDVALEYCSQLEIITRGFAIIADAKASAPTREAAMENLLRYQLFREIGPGFLFKIIPEKDLLKAAKVELRFYLNDQVAPIDCNVGSVPDRELYDELTQQQNILTNEVPDLRFPGKNNSITERIVNKSHEI